MFPEKYHYKTGTHCWFCDRRFGLDRQLNTRPGTYLTRTKEHIVSISRGGPNDIGNYVASCEDCNSLKGSMTAKQFAQWLDYKLKSKWENPMSRYFTLMIKRAWKAYNKTSKIHIKYAIPEKPKYFKVKGKIYYEH